MLRDSFQPLALLRRCIRPSSVARALWLAVALLHVWLVLRRVALGELTNPLDALRAGLCLLGVGYASLKFWQVATIFDSAPRRAFAFALILVLGHWVIAEPSQQGNLADSTGKAPVAAILVIAPALGAVCLMVRETLRQATQCASSYRLVPVMLHRHQLALVPVSETRRAVFYFHRPPPTVC